MVLLYIPPVQNLLRREVTAYASKATGMQIQVERIDLRFPLNLLVRGVEVIQQPDTLLSLESLNVRVQAWPLLKGKVEVDDVTLSQVAVNSADLIEGMQIKGVLGRFFLQSHGVDLSNETAVVNRAELSDTHIQLLMNDTTTAPKDTTASAPVNWKVDLHQLKLKNISFDMQLPADSLKMAAYIGEATVDDAKADLKNQFYGLRQFLLSGASASYDTGEAGPTEGFDASHMAVRNIRIGLDSLLYEGRNMNAVIREITMEERSGLSITSLTGRLFSNDSIIRIPDLKLQTPHSEINLSAQTYWELVNIPTTGRLSANLVLYRQGRRHAFCRRIASDVQRSISVPSVSGACRYGWKSERNADFTFHCRSAGCFLAERRRYFGEPDRQFEAFGYYWSGYGHSKSELSDGTDRSDTRWLSSGSR